jgi:glycosyltransferase involved in cell wall biosynthesis
MKIAFNRQPRRSPWGGGAHFATTFADYLVAQGHEVVYSLQSGLDWIVMLDPRAEAGGFSAQEISHWKHSIDKNVKVLHRVNDTGVTRGGPELDELIRRANYEVADRTVYISRWVQQHFRRLMCPEGAVVTNGCDERYFHPKLVMGLHQPVRLVTHHWSNNKMKGVDLYERIDELIDVGANFELTYVGRYPAGHVPKHIKIVEPLYGTALGDELRKHDVYVTAARHEACGSHHVEGAACGMPVIYHNDGGGVVEMCSRYGVGISDVREFQGALEKVLSDYRGYCEKALACDLSADTMCAKYLELMK